ncbi:hypothetical protein KIL84_008810 [Mauremys mutica]|uniref:Uncharacterized protein n=1 Tax=Mauremys mutica TaxID=74926 RepID=A0A9D3X3L0_9SAUR|nr:hypothetical protein KIL84_008810 [Mauremys mutica]
MSLPAHGLWCHSLRVAALRTAQTLCCQLVTRCPLGPALLRSRAPKGLLPSQSLPRCSPTYNPPLPSAKETPLAPAPPASSWGCSLDSARLLLAISPLRPPPHLKWVFPTSGELHLCGVGPGAGLACDAPSSCRPETGQGLPPGASPSPVHCGSWPLPRCEGTGAVWLGAFVPAAVMQPAWLPPQGSPWP